MSAEARTGARRRVLQNKIRLHKTMSAITSKAGDEPTAQRHARAADRYLAELLSVR